MQLTRTTKTVKPSDANVKWYLIDATDLVVGRLASQIAHILRGKDKVCFSPNQDCGDYVIVTNVEKMVLTGNKLEQKKYFRLTGYIGGMKETTAGKQMEAHPDRVLYEAVRTMLTRSRLGRQQMTKLRIFKGPEHAHASQNPVVLDIGAKNRKNKRSN